MSGATGGAAAPRDILFADLWIARSPDGVLATVHAGPSRDGRVRGTLTAVPRTGTDHRLRIGVDFRSPTGGQAAWIFGIGSRDEAATVFVLARRDNWIQLPADPFPSPVWLELNQGVLAGEVLPAVGRTFGFAGGIRAADLATGTAVTLDDDRRFVVERISGGEVILRAERSGTERYRVSLAKLFDGKGRPLLWPTVK